MIRIVINFGLENIDIIKADINKNKSEVLSHKTVASEKVFTINGTFDVKRAVEEVKKSLGTDIEHDVSVVLPDYMTRVKLFDVEELTKQKIKDLKESSGSKLNNKQVSYIGKNDAYDMTQVIFYNKKIMSAFIKEMHKQRINVVDVKSHFCALQNSLPLITNVMESIDRGASTNYLMVVVGTNSISTMVMMNNLPVYMSNSDYNLYALYSNIRESHPDLTFNDFIRALKKASPYETYTEEVSEKIVYLDDTLEAEEKRTIQELNKLTKDAFSDDLYAVPDEDSIKEETEEEEEAEAEEKEIEVFNDKYNSLISKEVKTIFEMVCQEIRDLTDLVNDKFGGKPIEIITNSKVAHRFIAYQLSDIFNVNENVNIGKEIQIGDIQIKCGNEIMDLDSLETIGLIVCDMKKEAEFYE